MLSTLVARRYLLSRSSRSVVNIISAVSIASIAVPLAAMIILLSIFNGLEGMIKGLYSTFDADFTISAKRGQSFDIGAVDSVALRNVEGVEAMSYLLEQQVIFERNAKQVSVTLRGVDDNYRATLPIDSIISNGRMVSNDDSGVVVGRYVAGQLGVRTLIDATTSIYAVRPLSSMSMLPFRGYTKSEQSILGVFAVDLESESRYVLAPISLAQEVLNVPNRVSSIAVRVEEGADLEQLKGQLERVVGEDFDVLLRSELRHSEFRVMEYEKWGTFFIAMLVLIIASFSIIGALSMQITEKRSDIATLRYLGGDDALCRAIFYTEGGLLCGVAAVIGIALGVGLTLLQESMGIIKLPTELFLTQAYPAELRWGDVAVTIIGFALVGTTLTVLTVKSMIRRG